MNLNNLQQHIPLAPYTSFNIGGVARYFLHAKKTEQIIEAVAAARKNNISFFVLGKGSNILISDKGFDGLVIYNDTSNIIIKNTSVSVESGVLLSHVIQKTIDCDLIGLEYFAGIPGTIGGAVRGNAGIPKWEIGDFVREAEIIDTKGIVQEVDKNYFKFGYRDSIIKHNNDVLLSITLTLKKGNKEECEQRKKEILESRIKKQPKGRSCGSFFKNPFPDKPAGMLIDQCGLKGFSIGGAKVSEQHANFLMNTGNATWEDFIKLITFIKEKVFEKFSINLEEEVQIIQ